MNDNFDLKAYMGSKRLLTENFEPQISEEELNDEEDNYEVENPEYDKEPRDLDDQNAENRTDYKEEPESHNYLEEDELDEIGPDEFSEDELMDDLNKEGEDIVNEITPEMAIGLIPAAGFAATIASLVASGVMAALENGSMGDKGKQFAAKLKSLASKSKPSSTSEEPEK